MLTSDEQKIFESSFGCPIPEHLMDLLSDKSLRESLPVVFRFDNLPFALSIQYFLSLNDPDNYDIEQRHLSFAVTSDGFDLVVDIGTEALKVFQNEYGDVDYLGIGIEDLLKAQRFSGR